MPEEELDQSLEMHRYQLHWHFDYPIVSTARNRALPLIMCSYPSAARSSGNTSFMARTPVSRLKESVSCESIELPEGQPRDRTSTQEQRNPRHLERLSRGTQDD